MSNVELLPTVVLSIIGAITGIASLLITILRFTKERPILNYEIQSCEYDESELVFSFIVNNSGERGTSITKLKLDYPHLRTSAEDPDEEYPYHMGWWELKNDLKESFIIFIPPTSSKSISAYFSLFQPNLHNMKVHFDIFTTSGNQRLFYEAEYNRELDTGVKIIK